MAKLTAAATRAARALLKWSMRDLAEQSRVSLPTILKLENEGSITQETADKIVAAFEAHGVEITNGEGTGARLRLPTANELALLGSRVERFADGDWGALIRGNLAVDRSSQILRFGSAHQAQAFVEEQERRLGSAR